MSRTLIFTIILGIILLVGCITSTNNTYSIKNATQDNYGNTKLQNTSINNSYQNSSSDLPICISASATNCRIVEGITKPLEISGNKSFGSQNPCVGNGTVNLTVSPMNPDDVGLVVPMGLMVGGHVTPIDHMYLQPVIFHSQPDTYNVYADADGVIEGIGVESLNPDNKYPKIRLTIFHTCKFYSIYNLLTSLSPKILNITGPLGPGQYYQKPIQVKAGDLLGKIGGQTLDLSVNYDKVILPGFLVPEHYEGESWKIHTVDPFDYFSEPWRSQLLAKNVRQVSPRGGKIDYDIDGKLVGNWFVEGSGGFPAQYVPDSWKNHASFAYNHIDPAHIIISFGNFDGQPRQFSVEDNSPDPKDVSVSTGLVKYQLVDTEYILLNGGRWDHLSYVNDVHAISGNDVKGVALVQMISDRKLKVELFPNQTDASFDDNAIIYER
ncbi:MAG: hypothetical protein Q7S22_02710 [Candidatus Micrarchaeota archaeon]|nr:hypothetical protein [Candidatus Micrarchaeota archaeon]